MVYNKVNKKNRDSGQNTIFTVDFEFHQVIKRVVVSDINTLDPKLWFRKSGGVENPKYTMRIMGGFGSPK